MKKSFIVLFTCFYLFAITDLLELLKIPSLIEHYHEHKQENNSISFSKFLQIHYSFIKTNDADAEKDKNLPFKSDCNFNLNIPFIIEKPVVFAFLPINEIAVRKNSFSFYQFYLGSSFTKAVWQPPQIC